MAVSFVSGDFNVLHPGHFRLLNYAKTRGDRLVVGLLAKSISSRANLYEDEVRLGALRSLRIVDEVILIERSILDSVEQLRPDFVVKGPEHREKVNVEEELIQRWGGRLMFVPSNPGQDLSEQFSDSFHNLVPQARDTRNFLERRLVHESRLEEIIQQFASIHTLVLGDAIVDEYVECEPIGMSREDASIAVSPGLTSRYIGGAAIVASHLSRMGAKTLFCSVVGSDEPGDFLRSGVSDVLDGSGILVDADRATTLKTRYRAGMSTLLRINKVTSLSVSKHLQASMFSSVRDWIVQTDGMARGLLFSDFNYGCLPQDLVESVIELTFSQRIFCSADSQTSSQLGDISRYRGADLITPTEHEARVALHDFDSGLVVISEKLLKITGAKNVILTLGASGCLITTVTEDGSTDTDKIQSLALNVVDSAGAGDSLFAIASLALQAGATIWEAAYLGSVGAALQVGSKGNTAISAEEMLEALHS